MIVSILLAAGYAASQGVNVSVNVDLQARVQTIENRLDIPVNSSLSAFLKSNTYMVSLVDTYACFLNGSNAHLIEFLANHTQVMDDALSSASVVSGSVYVATGGYAALGVIVQNNARFVIERGATGITYTVASGATCIIDDLNSGLFAYYLNGAVYSIFNYAQGNLLTQSTNLTSIYVQTINPISGTVQIVGLTIQNGTSFPVSPVESQLFYRSDLHVLYFWNSTAWASGGGGGGGADDDSAYLLSASASNFLFQNGTRALTSDWNVGTYGIYGCTWLNSTSISGSNYYLGSQILNFILQPSFIINKSGSYTQAWYGANSTLAFNNTDSVTVVQECHDALPAIGGEIFAVANFYNMSAQLNITKGNVRLEGENMGTASNPLGSTIFYENDGTNLAAVIYVHASCARLESFLVEGNYLNNPSGSNGLSLYNSPNPTIENVGVLYCKGSGIKLNGEFALYAKNVYSENNHNHNWEILNSYEDSFSGDISYGASVYGYCIYNNSYALTFSGCISDNDYEGVFVGCSNVFCHDNSFLGFIVNRPLHHGFDLEGSYKNSFIGCHVINPGQTTTNTYDGFILMNGTSNTPSTWNVIEGDYVVGNLSNKQRYGYNENDPAQNYNVLVGDVFTDALTANIYLQGPNSHADLCWNGTSWLS